MWPENPESTDTMDLHINPPSILAETRKILAMDPPHINPPSILAKTRKVLTMDPHINPTPILAKITTDSLKAVLWDALLVAFNEARTERDFEYERATRDHEYAAADQTFVLTMTSVVLALEAVAINEASR